MNKESAFALFVIMLIIYIAAVVIYMILTYRIIIKDWAYRLEKRMHLNGCESNWLMAIFMVILRFIAKY